MRRSPSQVPETVSRLLRSTLIQSPPTWYPSVLAHPPPVHPPQHSRARPSLDEQQQQQRRKTPSASTKRPKNPSRPKDIVYLEDRVRQQFFRDFPFEALRPSTLVEMRELQPESTVQGESWTELAQRGAYPTVEDTIAYVLTLRKHREMPLPQAYAKATAEFVKLRAAHEMSTVVAGMEARHYGATFSPYKDPFQRAFRKETAALDTNITARQTATGERSPTTFFYKEPYRWSSYVPRNDAPVDQSFSGGAAYVGRWRLPQPVAPPTSTEGGAEPAGDLLSAIERGAEGGSEAGGGDMRTGLGKSEDEMSDLEFLEATLGKTATSKVI